MKPTMEPSDLIGEWRGKAPNGKNVTLVFDAYGSVLWTVESEQYEVEPWARYVVRTTWPYWEIDIFDFARLAIRDITFLGILQPLAKNEFKMQGTPSNHGGRPIDFDGEAIVFAKDNA